MAYLLPDTCLWVSRNVLPSNREGTFKAWLSADVLQSIKFLGT